MPEVNMQSDMAGHRIRRFGAVDHLAFFGRTAVFHIGAVEYQAVLFLRGTPHM